MWTYTNDTPEPRSNFCSAPPTLGDVPCPSSANTRAHRTAERMASLKEPLADLPCADEDLIRLISRDMGEPTDEADAAEIRRLLTLSKSKPNAAFLKSLLPSGSGAPASIAYPQRVAWPPSWCLR